MDLRHRGTDTHRHIHHRSHTRNQNTAQKQIPDLQFRGACDQKQCLRLIHLVGRNRHGILRDQCKHRSREHTQHTSDCRYNRLGRDAVYQEEADKIADQNQQNRDRQRRVALQRKRQ